MSRAFRIFISCVSTEFSSYRTDLRTALAGPDREVKIQEDFHDGAGTLLEKLNSYIARCQAVLHLIGESAGERARPAEVRWLLETYPDFATSLPELADDLDPEACRLTYAQWECYLALYHRIPCYIYRAGASSNRESGWTYDHSSAAKQADHVRRLCALGQDRRTQDFADARDVALRFLNSYLADGGQAPVHRAAVRVVWPEFVAGRSYPLADRQREFDEFAGMLRDNASTRILLVCGPSDRGKSVLLAQFFSAARGLPGVHAGQAEFKTSLPLAEVLYDLRRDLPDVRFPRFERDLDRGAVQTAWAGFLRDLEEASGPVILILDTYEQATDEAKQWVQNSLLPLGAKIDALRFIIAGQVVPDVCSSPRVASVVRTLQLPPIHDPAPWCQYGRHVVGLGANVPDEHIRTLVAAAVGSPRVVGSLLGNLKVRGGGS